MNNANPSRSGSNRRNFIKTLGALGAGIAAVGAVRSAEAAATEAVASRPAAARYMGGFAAPKLEKVRWGVIGVGTRGSSHVRQLAQIEGSDIVAICDLYEDWAKRSAKNVVKFAKTEPALYFGSPAKYHELLARPDIDAVIIATPWEEHAPMAIAAMEAGKHAFVEVLLAFTVPVRGRAGGHSLAEVFEHRWRPVSAGFAVPVFAFFAAGVSIADAGGLGTGLTNAVTLGIIAGLVVGKVVGITGSTWLVQRFTRARLADGLSWWDVVGLALLGGIGFTVSLLIGELVYGSGTVRDGYAKVGVLAGSLLSALLATVVLRLRNRHYRQLCAEEGVDTDADGVPDVYETRQSGG